MRDQKTHNQKLKFQAWHRGSRENDLLLGRFVDQYVVSSSPPQLKVLEQFLQETDGDIWNWVVYKELPPFVYQDLIAEIRMYHAS